MRRYWQGRNRLRETTDEKRKGEFRPLHKWQDDKSLSQQIVLDSQKTSLMLQMTAQSTKCDL